MMFTPVRRLAAGATAAAILAGAFLIPAAVAVAEELPIDTALTVPQPGAGADESAAARPVAEPSSDLPVDAPVELPDDAPVVPVGASAESDEPAATGSAAPPVDHREPAPAAAASQPVASLTGEAFIAAGDTWVGVIAVDDARNVRVVALGSRFEITMTDSAGVTRSGAAANGYADLSIIPAVPDGGVTVAIHNLASIPQEIPYIFGWDARDITAGASVTVGRPEIGISVFPTRGDTQLVANVVARIIAADGSVRTENLTGSAGFYHAEVAGLAPGRYLVETDALVLGLHRYAVRTVTVAAAETTPPTVAIATAQQQAPGGWFPGDVDVTLTASDAGSGVQYLYWGVDTTTLDFVSGAVKSFRVSGEGTHQVRYQANDWQGNLSAIATRQINIDHTDPEVSLQGFVDGEEFEQDELVAIEYACEDALSGIQSCVGDIGSGDFLDTSTPGTRTFRVTATDRAGNEHIVDRSYTVLEPDTTDPVVDVDVPEEPASGWYLDEVTVRFSASDESGIRRIHYEYGTMQGTVSRDIEGDTAEITFDRTQLYSLSYWAEDNAGNRSEGRTLNLYVDSDAPWIDVYSPDEDELSILPNGHFAQHERVEVDIRCDDIGSGIATCDATTPDGELLPTGVPGTHELRIVATDVAGHRTERVVTYTVDAAPAPGGSQGGAVGGATGGRVLATTGAQDVVPGLALAVILLGAGAALAIRRRVRTR
ncbi:hypothetical protein H4J02_02140 [Protaetiibacter sp. SSC-01]|uniref:OmpL47-type beta-barrel domain-containing protein n=1 Tax=Protaetiibacter sp. SSC-01 TaxID=2759943 RepID=UPI001656E4A9|nr:hypothetical protein [Protaetiibacter sp. SSC-01]QNO37863.1 hypothetical protein H4J02_02140 [Protaetiibacter sp. SSC-01]